MAKRSKPEGKIEPPRTVLVQTRVKYELYQRIKRCADAETLPVSAYVRRALHNIVPGGA